MLRASRFVLNINYRQLSINYFVNFFRNLFVHVYSCSLQVQPILAFVLIHLFYGIS